MRTAADPCAMSAGTRARTPIARSLACGVLLALLACSRDDEAPPPAPEGADAELVALADTLLPALERLSALEARRPVQLARRTPEQVRAFIEAQLADELPPEELQGVRDAYALLGLIPDSLDLRALLLELYSEQIVGYYDPAEKKLFVVQGVPAEAVRPVVAHELVHALQDQHTNLDSLISRERGNDRQSAAQAAIEGHATLVMFALLAEEAAKQQLDPAALPNPSDQLRSALEAPAGQFPVFRSAPRIVRETLLFPYIDGARFVQELWRAQPRDRRAAPLDSLLPQSTEQVLDPHTRFITTRDEPTELRFTDETAWQISYENSLGQLETGIFLREQLGSANDSAAAGWDGDRYRLLRAPGGETAIDWYSVWDDAAAADRFAAQLNRILSGRLDRAGAVTRVTIDQRPAVRVTIAPHSIALPIPPSRVRIQPADSTRSPDPHR